MAGLTRAAVVGTAHRRGMLALIKVTWAAWLQDRGFFFVLAFGWMVPPLTALFVWSAASSGPAEGGVAVGGMQHGALVAYYLVLMLVNQLTYSQTNWTVGDLIREGYLSTWLLRPLPPLYYVLASELAGKLIFLLFTGPAVLLLGLALAAAGMGPELHTTPASGLWFGLSLALAWGLRFFWGLWVALLAFWATRADALLAVQDALVFLLAGVVAPLALLPGAMQLAARVLPFRYMLGFPVEVLAGQLSAAELAAGFSLQFAWLALAVGLSWGLWRSGLRRYAAVGG
jgi:ABC-2 type transport system permease protein